VIGQWKSFLLDRSGEWSLPTGGEWRFLCNNNYHPHCSNMNLLWFHNGDEFPRVVTKLFHDAILPKREFENLKRVYPCASAWVPKPLHFGLQGTFWALWMEGVPGFRMSASDRLQKAELGAIVDVIASMHAALRATPISSDSERWRRLVSEPLRTLAQFGSAPAVQAGCKELAARCPADWIDLLPLTPQHGDLFASNLLSYRGRWHVVDWESFGTIDLPFYDVFTLLLSLLRASGETPDKWSVSLTRQVPALIERYAQSLGLSTRVVSCLFPLALANWFHLQWLDGRREFGALMYQAMDHYFRHPDRWEAVFVPAGMENR